MPEGKAELKASDKYEKIPVTFLNAKCDFLNSFRA